MKRGLIWLFGTLALAGTILFALAGICQGPSEGGALSAYFCGRPGPGSTGGEARR